MRVEGVVLEDHRDVAVFGGHVVDHPLADADLAVGDLLQAGDHAQRGRLAAAGRADQHHELLVPDVQVQVVDGGDFVIPFEDVLEGDLCQWRYLSDYGLG